MRIYLAGPLFTTAERSFNASLRDSLEQFGHDVWLPQEHEPREKVAKEIFLMDVEGLEQSDVVIANMDGPDPDSGTCWECGYAYGKKPVILYRTDFRAAGDAPGAAYNLMLSESAHKRFDIPFADAGALATAIQKELSSLELPRSLRGNDRTMVESRR